MKRINYLLALGILVVSLCACDKKEEKLNIDDNAAEAVEMHEETENVEKSQENVPEEELSQVLPENPYRNVTERMVGYWTDGEITYYMNSFIQNNEYVFFYTKADEENNWYRINISETTDEHNDYQQDRYHNDTLYAVVEDAKGNSVEAEMNLLKDTWEQMYYLYIDTKNGQKVLKKLPPYMYLESEVRHVVLYMKFVDLTLDENNEVVLTKQEIGHVDSEANLYEENNSKYILYDSAEPTGYYYFQYENDGIIYKGYKEESGFIEKISGLILPVEETPDYAAWQMEMIENPLLDYEVIEKGYDIFSGYTVEDDLGNLYLYTNAEKQRMTRYELNSHVMEFVIDTRLFTVKIIDEDMFNETAMAEGAVPKYLESDIEAYKCATYFEYVIYGNGIYLLVDTGGNELSIDLCRMFCNCFTPTLEKKDLADYAKTMTFNGWNFAENTKINVVEQTPNTNTGFSLIAGTIGDSDVRFLYYLDKSMEDAMSGSAHESIYNNPYSDNLEMRITCTDYTYEYNGLYVGVIERPREYLYICASDYADSSEYFVRHFGELWGLEE